jgi:hypothetical protein
MIGYIATVVALSVPVSLTCVHLAFPLLQGNRRPCGFAAEAQAAASAAALLMCVVMALWAGLGRGRGSASALAVGWALASAALLLVLKWREGVQAARGALGAEGVRQALERFGRRARDAWARWSGAAASFGYDVYRSWAKAGAEDEMEVWDGGEAGGQGGGCPMDKPDGVDAASGGADVAVFTEEDIAGQLRSVMELLCTPEVVRDPEVRRRLVRRQRHLHAVAAARRAAAGFGADPRRLERHYAMRTERINVLLEPGPGGGSRGLRAGSWELGLGRELTDDSHS